MSLVTSLNKNRELFLVVLITLVKYTVLAYESAMLQPDKGKMNMHNDIADHEYQHLIH